MANNQNLATLKNRKSCSSKTTRLTHIQHALNNPNSRKHAMNAKCWDCCGGGLLQSESKGVRKEIALCTITDCSLWNFRPYKNEKARKVSTLARALDLSLQQNHEVNKK